MEITEKVAYLKGLAEGMELDTEKKEGKLLAAIIDVLDDIALEIADMKADQEELYDGLRGDHLLRRVRPGGRRGHLPQLRREAGVRSERPGGRGQAPGRGIIPICERRSPVLCTGLLFAFSAATPL